MKREDLLTRPVEDLDVARTTSMEQLVESFKSIGGFSASKLATAFSIMKKMLTEKNTTFLSFPADIISTGLRGLINELVKRKLVDVLITTTGTLDHDIARAFGKYYCGTFETSDKFLRSMKINRLGNVFVPDESYGTLIEDKVQPMLDDLFSKQKRWGCADLIREVGLKIDKEDSILYNAAKNSIPVYVPGITDGSFGSQIWSYYERDKAINLDLLKDEHELSDIIFDAKKSGALMIGGGISKHHTIWWNQFRGGLDYAVYMTTAQEYDGSLSGARLEEAISWKKMKEDAEFVNVYGDATILLPILIAPFL